MPAPSRRRRPAAAGRLPALAALLLLLLPLLAPSPPAQPRLSPIGAAARGALASGPHPAG